MVSTAVMQSADAVAIEAGRYSSVIRDLGARSGDRFGVVVSQDNSIGALRAVAAAWGALTLGVTPVMVNADLPQAQQDTILRDARVHGVINTQEVLATSLMAQEVGLPLGRPMHYTSGTTGKPKGVWGGVLNQSDAAKFWGEEQSLWQFTDADRHLIHGFLTHSAPLRFAIATVLAGGSLISVGKFTSKHIENAIREFSPTTAFVVPTHLRRMQSTSLASPYRLLVHAGESCPDAVRSWTHDWAGTDAVWEFYGSTEGQFTSLAARDYASHPLTVGRARPNRTLRITDGLIWCRVPNYATWEYWEDPQATNAAWCSDDTDAWFTVGDCGILDDDGYLTLLGRKDDLIISGGMNISPLFVETALESIDGVAEAVVFAVPDEQWGQRVCAAYCGSSTVNEIRDAARHLLASHQRPKDFIQVTSIPRNPNGKRIRSLSAVREYLP